MSVSQIDLTLCVIDFAPVSRSLGCSLDDARVWHWLFERVRRQSLPFELKVLLHSGAEPPEWRLDGFGEMPPVHFITAPSQIAALHDLVIPGGWETVVSLTLNSAFAPIDSVMTLLGQHWANKSWFTNFSGLPPGVSPSILDRQLIQLAAGVSHLSGEMMGINGMEAFFQKCVAIAHKTDFPQAKTCSVSPSLTQPFRSLFT